MVWTGVSKILVLILCYYNLLVAEVFNARSNVFGSQKSPDWSIWLSEYVLKLLFSYLCQNCMYFIYDLNVAANYKSHLTFMVCTCIKNLKSIHLKHDTWTKLSSIAPVEWKLMTRGGHILLLLTVHANYPATQLFSALMCGGPLCCMGEFYPMTNSDELMKMFVRFLIRIQYNMDI